MTPSQFETWLEVEVSQHKSATPGLSVKAGMENRGTEWGGYGGNARNRGGNAGNLGENVENQVGNVGNIIEIEKTKWKFLKSNSLFFAEIKKKVNLSSNVNICFMKLET